jgi:FkbM family methyltransferase
MKLLKRANAALKRRLPEGAYALVVNVASTVAPGMAALRVTRAGTRWKIAMPDGELFILSPRRASLYSGGLRRRFDKLVRQYAFAPRVVVEAGDLVLDLGSNIGEFAFAASALASRVVAVEPDPVAAECLRANAARYPNVQVQEKLLWKGEEDMTFTLAYDNADSTLFSVDPGKERGRVTLRSTTLDAVMAAAGVDRVDFLKLDAEGAEPEVLMGASRTLARTRKAAIDCRAERMGESTADEVVALLADHGFQTHVSDDQMVYAWRAEPGAS